MEAHKLSLLTNFSRQLMTLATAKGDTGAEAIALEVGGYLGEVGYPTRHLSHTSFHDFAYIFLLTTPSAYKS